jgi:hypothetical protein
VEYSRREALEEAVLYIKQAVGETQHRLGPIKLRVAGDFNRHNGLWGGDTVATERQRERQSHCC